MGNVAKKHKSAKHALKKRPVFSLNGTITDTRTCEEREKGNAGALKLPAQALSIIEAQPRIKRSAFAATRGDGPLNGFNKRKATFDKACGVTGWPLHDLRRMARFLMSRAGVVNEHAERVLGPQAGGRAGGLRSAPYFEEKSAVLARLAALIQSMVNNKTSANVLPLRPAMVPS